MAAKRRSEPKESVDLDVKVGPALERFRTDQGLSIQKLATRAGVSSGTIHKIEKGTMVPSINVLLKLARALGRPVGDLVSEDIPEVQERFAVFRAAKRPELSFADLRVSLQATAAKLPDRQLDAGIYVVEPGATTSSEPLAHPGEKIYLVLQGKVRFFVGDRKLTLHEGDVLHLKAELPHRWENLADGESRFFFCLTPPIGP